MSKLITTSVNMLITSINILIVLQLTIKKYILRFFKNLPLKMYQQKNFLAKIAKFHVSC